mmetsp:Transcript_19187/g.57036  ORF Transcript_19187/g.57036 Transcript_19187/m.57036 type:complete len:453 (-) Transcript_19187:175-1533(-)
MNQSAAIQWGPWAKGQPSALEPATPKTKREHVSTSSTPTTPKPPAPGAVTFRVAQIVVLTALVMLSIFCVGCSWNVWCCGWSGRVTPRGLSFAPNGTATSSAPTRPVTNATRISSKFDRCTFTQAKKPLETRFDVVLLSTYPRSGNSWLRLLLHGATQFLDRGLATKPQKLGMKVLTDLIEYARCADDDCTDQEIATFLHRELHYVPDKGNGEVADERTLSGINAKPTHKAGLDCLQFITALNEKGSWRKTPHSVTVKSHYPETAGTTAVEQFTERVTRVVHTVRNPFDNIASRFLGNHHRNEERFNALEKARLRNRTTDAFANFLPGEVDKYREFHEYWLERRVSDAAVGIPTMYARYESLCHNTKDVVAAIAQFAAFDIQWPSFQCELEMSPCSVGAGGFPQHLHLYTDEQIDYVLRETAHLIEPFGYRFDHASKRMLLGTPSIPMCNGP